MKKFPLIIIAGLFLAFPGLAAAGVLIDFTIATSGTTTVASGQSDFQVAAISGTANPATGRPYKLDSSTGDVTIKNVDQLDLTKDWSIQLDEVTEGVALDGDNTGTTCTVLIQFSNDDDSWTLSGTSSLIDGVLLSGNSRYVVQFPPTVARFARLIWETGITVVSVAKAKLLIP
jgi:hypothetical protein